MRVYLAGRLTLESGRLLLEEEALPARQGRLAFAYLFLNRRRPVARRELLDALWGEDPPPAWEAALSALLSRLRRLLAPVASIETVSGSLHLSLLEEAWLDLEAAGAAIDEAEGLCRGSDHSAAWGPASVAVAIARRGFLPGETQAWVAGRRQQLELDLVRGLECLATISLVLEQAASAVRFAGECVQLEPFRESAHELLIRAHLAAGNRAEALRTYTRLRRLLADELGTDPSPAVEAAYLEALRA